MKENKQTYFDNLIEFETFEIFLTDRTDIIKDEIYHNCLSLGLTLELAREISVNDILGFLCKVKANRKKQLAASNFKVGLIYYLWDDEMAGYLKLNFINSNHVNLPFGCNLNFVQNESLIVENFLKSTYLDGIPFEELTDSETYDRPDQETYKLNVFKELIR